MTKKAPTLFALVGLPFSGKTTLGQQLADRIGARMLAYDWTWARTHPADQVPDPDDTASWLANLEAVSDEIQDVLSHQQSVVFDHINHTRRDRDQLRTTAARLGVPIKFIFLDVPLEETLKRREANLKTGERHHVASPNLDKVLDAWEQPVAENDVVTYHPGDDLDEFARQLLT